MTHPLNTDFWYGWPGAIAVGYLAFGIIANPEMPVLTRLWAGAAGGVMLVVAYWVVWRVIARLTRSRPKPAEK